MRVLGVIMEKCPCGSGLAYGACCEPLHQGKKEAPTAEALMRARYAAYAKGQVDFIERTHRRDERDQYSSEETKKWAQESQWLGLEVLSVKQGRAEDETGTVEFVASYIQHGLKETYREVAEFQKEGGRWLYDKGTVVPTTVTRAVPKVGRNELCPCGSGKKYKHCHGAGA